MKIIVIKKKVENDKNSNYNDNKNKNDDNDDNYYENKNKNKINGKSLGCGNLLGGTERETLGRTYGRVRTLLHQIDR